MDGNKSRGSNDKNLYLGQLVTLEDLLKFKVELIEEIQKIWNNKNTTDSKKWLKSAEVRKLLSISAGSLQNLRISGLLPFTKIGGAFYYRSDDIEKMLEKSKT